VPHPVRIEHNLFLCTNPTKRTESRLFAVEEEERPVTELFSSKLLDKETT